jgi:hypothetical protein
MKRTRGFLRFNSFVQDPEFTQTTVELERAFRTNDIVHDDITIVTVLIGYPKWYPDTDFFTYVKKRVQNQMKEDKKCFFLFDASTEGFSTIYGEPYFDILYKMAEKYDIDPRRIFFTSSNMKDNDNIMRYNMEHNIKTSINVFTYLNFEQMIFGTAGQTEIELSENLDVDAVVEKRINTAVKRTKLKYHHPEFSKLGLSLSRVNRPHRTFSAMEIFNSNHFKDMYVSHGSLKGMNLDYYLTEMPFPNSGVNFQQLKNFKKQLPLIVDTEDFKTNHATALHSDLNDQSLFQIVNETFVNDWHGTSLFWSEKTFRSIYHMQPFVIWGQPGINKRMVDYGYKLYDDWFDLSFDDINDPVKRWRALWKEVRKQMDYIRTLPTVKQHIRWKFKNERVLVHNFRTLLEGKYTKETFKNVALKMRDLADE